MPRRSTCKAEAAAIAAVNGKGGGRRAAKNTAQTPRFSIFPFSLSNFFDPTNFSAPSLPTLRITRSTRAPPTTEPSAAARVKITHRHGLRSLLTSAISRRSLPKGRKRKEESPTPRKNKPSAPILRKRARTERAQVEEIKSVKVRIITARTSNLGCKYRKGARVLKIGRKYHEIGRAACRERVEIAMCGVGGAS